MSGNNSANGGGRALDAKPDPNAPSSPTETTAIRYITFWNDGFTIGDGELMRYDDPMSKQILEEINAGRAPPSLLSVLPGQRIELRVAKRTNEKYVTPTVEKLDESKADGFLHSSTSNVNDTQQPQQMEEVRAGKNPLVTRRSVNG
ncbi:hypothetical protein HGRIS_010631 [Hohenbuehelia grisea]|uniref:SEP domain-containing protein n=1 Tax=Hohenbuehelia grisea TaxID=104357 RepID=A0ABR3IXN7_9AGAR